MLLLFFFCHLPDPSLRTEMGFHNRPYTVPNGNFRAAGAEKSLGPESSLQPLPVDHHVALSASSRKADSKYKSLGNVLSEGHFYITH